MTKSQNTKNEQQKDLCITSEQLTEQWKKDELIGEYWCEITESPYPERVYLPTCNSDIIVKVLAPVPTFDEWEQLQNWADFTNDYHELREKLEIAEYENAQLKELLKECKAVIKDVDTYCTKDATEGYVLVNKIDEVLK